MSQKPASSDRPPEALRLDNQLCFALYGAANRMTRLYRPMLDALGLTYPQYLAMLVLWEASPRTVGALGDACTVQPPPAASSTAPFCLVVPWSCAESVRSRSSGLAAVERSSPLLQAAARMNAGTSTSER